MSVQKRTWKRSDGTTASGWRVRWRDPDGKQRSETFDYKADADAHDKMVGADMARGDYLDPNGARTIFDDYAEMWRASRVHRRTSAAPMERAIRIHLIPAFTGRQLGTIRRTEVQALVKRVSQTQAPATVQRTFGYLSAIFSAAVEDGLIRKSPCADVTLPKKVAGDIEPWTAERVALIVGALGPKYQAMAVLAASTGLRQGELLGLPFDRIDMLRRTVTVAQQMITVPGRKPYLGPPKSTASRRTVPLPRSAVDALARHLAQWPAVPTLVDRETPTGGFAEDVVPLVFTSTIGRPISRAGCNNNWRRALARVGLPEAGNGMHHLRHFYASMLIAGGEDVKVVQSRLGHSSAQTTLNIYGHLWPHSEGRTRDIVDRMFGDVLDPAAELSEGIR